MSFPDDGPLVDTAWLAANLGNPRLRILDATFVLPGAAVTNAPFRALPGAARFDVDAIKDPASALPHMLPSVADFEGEVQARGIGPEDAVVCYDAEGFAGAARCWWMFRVFGHDRIRVLDGGLAGWAAAGLPTDDAHQPVRPGVDTGFRARFRPGLLRNADQVLEALQSGTARVLDARPAGRFAGSQPEPRPGLRSGHMPGARNLPAASLLDPTGRYLLAPGELAPRLAAAGALEGEVVASCGSGMTACVIALAAAAAGRPDVAVYDGSWTEWGGRADLPVVTG